MDGRTAWPDASIVKLARALASELAMDRRLATACVDDARFQVELPFERIDEDRMRRRPTQPRVSCCSHTRAHVHACHRHTSETRRVFPPSKTTTSAIANAVVRQCIRVASAASMAVSLLSTRTCTSTIERSEAHVLVQHRRRRNGLDFPAIRRRPPFHSSARTKK